MLEGKTVFVSGGTGAIGEAICRICAGYGARVIFSYHRNEDKASALSADIPGSTAVCINMRDLKDIDAKCSSLAKEIESIDALINNAGVSQVMPFSLLEEEDYDMMMDINVKGTFFLTKQLVRPMIRRKKGAIVNIGSIAGHRMYDVPVHYALSKAALAGFTYSLASELKKFNIRVNSIVPGLVEGGISKGIPDEMRNDFISHCASGRPCRPEEIGELAAFLASDKCSYLNGQNILVDGGI
jgi:3-oxoacyl-[acyl-carrier protein] reductase